MSSSRLVAAIFVLSALLLSACGFTPMYASDRGAQIAGGLGSIEIENIPDRDGQQLRNLLTDRLYRNGRPASPAYLLRITKLHTEIDKIGIRKDAAATRGQMQTTADLALIDKASGKVVLERNLKSVGAYNILDNQFATLVSRENLSEHILEEMSDNIVTELGLFLNRTTAETP